MSDAWGIREGRKEVGRRIDCIAQSGTGHCHLFCGVKKQVRLRLPNKTTSLLACLHIVYLTAIVIGNRG